MSVQTIFVVTIVVLLALAALQVFVVRRTEK